MHKIHTLISSILLCSKREHTVLLATSGYLSNRFTPPCSVSGKIPQGNRFEVYAPTISLITSLGIHSISLDFPLILWLVVCGDENHDTHNENKIQQRPGLGELSRRGVCYLWEVT